MKNLLLPLVPFLFLASVASAGDPTGFINVGGLRIFREIEKQSAGNLCLSPYSIQAALAMTYAGAEESTSAQMEAALGFPRTPGDLASAFRELDTTLAASAQKSGADTSLLVANRLFGATGFSFRSAFLDLLKQDFSAPLQELDFKANPSKAADFINQWVEKQTADRIRKLIPAGSLKTDTTLVLVNALYLKIPWADEFPEGATIPRAFLAGGREEVQVPTMNRTGSFGYLQDGGFTAVGIPFRGGEFQFLVLLPEKATCTALPTPELLDKCAKLSRSEVRLFLPKFRLEPPTISLAHTLQALGIKAAFDIPQGSANFNGMAPRRPDDYLYISDVFHKTFFALDEKGVEAAAATAVVMMRATAMPVRKEPVEVRVDRPFLFAIQHIPTSSCLFLGRVVDPR